MPDPRELLIECAFLLPKRRDAHLSDGEEHEHHVWEWLRNEMFDQFHGVTMAPGFYAGYYKDPDTGGRVADQSLKFIVAIPEGRIVELRGLLSAACVMFAQKCIYLSVAGQVEFVEVSDATTG